MTKVVVEFEGADDYERKEIFEAVRNAIAGVKYKPKLLKVTTEENLEEMS
jgi:hypothetical protein